MRAVRCTRQPRARCWNLLAGLRRQERAARRCGSHEVHVGVRPACALAPRRPGVYREFTRDLADKVSAGAQSHNTHKLVGFEPLASAALTLRVAASLGAAYRREATLGRAAAVDTAHRLLRAAALWVVLCALKLALGFGVKRAARWYAARPRPAAARRRVQALAAAAALSGGGGGTQSPSLHAQQQQARKDQ